MALVPFKNLQRFLQEKCDKHLKISKKDLSRVAKFVSHNGMYLQSADNNFIIVHKNIHTNNTAKY